MSLVVNQNVVGSYSCENFNEKKLDFSEIFTREVVLKIFSHLHLATFGTVRSVSKEWKKLTNEPGLIETIIYRKIAFGSDKWAHYCGEDAVKEEDREEEFCSLPASNFIADCKKFKTVFPEKKVEDILMLVRLPKTLNGGLTLKSLIKLAEVHFPNGENVSRFISSHDLEEMGDKSIDKSYWVLMTKDVLPGSKSKSYSKQQKIVAELAEKSITNYEFVESLEAITCIWSQYFSSNRYLFGNNPRTDTLCKDKLANYPVLVGNFSSDGICVQRYISCSDSIGVAVLQKF